MIESEFHFMILLIHFMFYKIAYNNAAKCLETLPLLFSPLLIKCSNHQLCNLKNGIFLLVFGLTRQIIYFLILNFILFLKIN